MVASIKSDGVSLSISCVYYNTEPGIFSATLASLAAALNYLKANIAIESSELHLINNNPDAESLFLKTSSEHLSEFELIITHSGHGNIGYGRGNNIAIQHSSKKYHLILNPDVELAIDSLYRGISYLEANSATGLIAPNAENQYGQIEYLAKRTPSLLIIFLRGLNNTVLNSIFKQQLDDYTYKDKIPSNHPVEIELASGCFMLCRTRILQACKGFSTNYFLYFEDFDLSRKISRYAKIEFIPDMKIKHLGGNASQKGVFHIFIFLISALKFKLQKKQNT